MNWNNRNWRKIATLNEDIYTVNLNLIMSETLVNISEKYPLCRGSYT